MLDYDPKTRIAAKELMQRLKKIIVIEKIKRRAPCARFCRLDAAATLFCKIELAIRRNCT
jgi:hypothetical protein